MQGYLTLSRLHVVVAANYYLTNATEASIYIAAHEALPENLHVVSPTLNAVVQVGDTMGQAVPNGLTAASCKAGSNVSHFGPNGGTFLQAIKSQ